MNPAPFIPTENFKKLSKDLHEIRTSVLLLGFEKAKEMKKCIEQFLLCGSTTDAEWEKAHELLMKIKNSDAKRQLDESQRRIARRN